IILTIFTYFHHKKIRDYDISQLLEYYSQLYININQMNLDLEVFKYLIYDYNFIDFDLYINCIDKFINGIINEPIDIVREKFNNIKNNEKKNHVVINYLKNILIKKFRYSKEVINCSFIDIISNNFSYYKCGFSGTTNIKLPKFIDKEHNFVDTKYNLKNVGASYAAIIGNTRMPNRILFVENNNLIDSIIKNLDGTDAFIDVGAFFSSYNIDEILDFFITNYKSKQYFIYIDEKDELMVKDRKNDDAYNYDGVSKYDNCFMIYDNKH